MNQKFKLTPNTILVLIILTMVLIVNIFSTLSDFSSSKIATIESYRNSVFPLNILDLVKFILIIFMGWLIFGLIKRVAGKDKWSEKYYRRIKQIGWLSIFLILLDAISFVIREQYISINKDLATLSADPGIYTDIIAHALFSSPITWFLVVCIFLLADALEYSNKNSPA